MIAARMTIGAGRRQTQGLPGEDAALSATPPKLTFLPREILPGRLRGDLNRGLVREFRLSNPFNRPAFVPPREGPSDRGHAAMTTLTAW